MFFTAVPDGTNCMRKSNSGTRKKGHKNLSNSSSEDEDVHIDEALYEMEEEKEHFSGEDEIEHAGDPLNTKDASITVKALYGKFGETFLPILTFYFTAMQKVVTKFKINDKMCILIYEMCLSSLRLDSTSNPTGMLSSYFLPLIGPPNFSVLHMDISLQADILDQSGGHLLVPLHAETIDLLRAVFRTYPSHRAPILQVRH